MELGDGDGVLLAETVGETVHVTVGLLERVGLKVALEPGVGLCVGVVQCRRAFRSSIYTSQEPVETFVISNSNDEVFARLIPENAAKGISI